MNSKTTGAKYCKPLSKLRFIQAVRAEFVETFTDMLIHDGRHFDKLNANGFILRFSKILTSRTSENKTVKFIEVR